MSQHFVGCAETVEVVGSEVGLHPLYRSTYSVVIFSNL